MEKIENGAPFFFGGYSSQPLETYESSKSYKIAFAVTTKIYNINYNDDVYKLFELDMYDVDTLEFLGKHSLQEVLIETKINKSYFAIEFEIEEEAKFNLLRE